MFVGHAKQLFCARGAWFVLILQVQLSHALQLNPPIEW